MFLSYTLLISEFCGEELPVTVWGYPVVLWRFKRSCLTYAEHFTSIGFLDEFNDVIEKFLFCYCPFASLIGAWSCFEMFLIQQNAIQAEARHIRITSGIDSEEQTLISVSNDGLPISPASREMKFFIIFNYFCNAKRILNLIK